MHPSKLWRDWRFWLAASGAAAIGALAVTQTETYRTMRLEPETRKKYATLRSRLAARGIEIYTGSTRRTLEEQEKLLAAGKSAVPISWHMVGRAVDAYPINPDTGKPDLAGKRKDLFRVMHVEWAKLGGFGLAFAPYPSGELRYITTSKGKVWDGGHLEFHGPFKSAIAAYKAESKAIA